MPRARKNLVFQLVGCFRRLAVWLGLLLGATLLNACAYQAKTAPLLTAHVPAGQPIGIVVALGDRAQYRSLKTKNHFQRFSLAPMGLNQAVEKRLRGVLRDSTWQRVTVVSIQSPGTLTPGLNTRELAPPLLRLAKRYHWRFIYVLVGNADTPELTTWYTRPDEPADFGWVTFDCSTGFYRAGLKVFSINPSLLSAGHVHASAADEWSTTKHVMIPGMEHYHGFFTAGYAPACFSTQASHLDDKARAQFRAWVLKTVPSMAAQWLHEATLPARKTIPRIA